MSPDYCVEHEAQDKYYEHTGVKIMEMCVETRDCGCKGHTEDTAVIQSEGCGALWG